MAFSSSNFVHCSTCDSGFSPQQWKTLGFIWQELILFNNRRKQLRWLEMAWQLKVYGFLIESQSQVPRHPQEVRKALGEHTHGKFKFTILNILAQKPIPEKEPWVCRCYFYTMNFFPFQDNSTVGWHNEKHKLVN